MEFQRYKIVQDGDQYTLELYLSNFHEEFASELGDSPKKREGLFQEARKFAREQYPNLKINTIKILAGAMVIGVINLGDLTPNEVRAESSTYQTVSGIPLLTHKVISGDSLSIIARKYNVTVTDIKQINGLTTDMIYVGQTIKIPIYSYIVVSGDTLSLIAKKLNTTVTAIKTANKLTSDNIYIGQKLLIPVPITNATTTTTTQPEPTPAPAPTQTEQNTINYTVKSGDSLSLIAKNHGTTVQEIQRLNSLTTTNIFPGQVLIVPQNTTTPPTTIEPAPTAPTETVTQTTYSVVLGDTLSIIAKRYNVTVDALRTFNNLTSDMIFVGQQLTIPSTTTTDGTTATPEPAPEETTNVPSETVEPTPTETTVTYTVVSGDTLSLIAKRFNVSVDSLKTANHLTSDIIFVGHQLIIPGEAPTPTETAEETPTTAPEEVTEVPTDNVEPAPTDNVEPAPTETVATYTVVSGDTLSLIAKRYNTTVTAIKETNALTTDTIYVGQTLSVPTMTQVVEEAAPVVVVDSTPPDVPTLGTLAIINQNNVTTYELTGKTEAGARVVISFSDENNQTIQREVTADGDGNFTIRQSLATLADGVISIGATSTDEAGNKSETLQQNVTKDVTAPTDLVFDNKETITSKNQHSFIISGSVTDATQVRVEFIDQHQKNIQEELTVENNSYQRNMDFSGLSDGVIIVKLIAVDEHGNETNVSTRELTKDTISPDTPAVTIPSFINTANEHAVILSGKTEPGSLVSMVVSDETNTMNRQVTADVEGNFSVIVDARIFNEGRITVETKSIDKAGNESDSSIVQTIKDVSVGEILISDLAPINKEQAVAYKIQGKGEPNTNVTISFADLTGATITRTIKTDETGSFVESIDLSTLKDGAVTVLTYQMDEANNKSNVITKVVQKDTEAPTQVILNPLESVSQQNVDVYTVSGTGEPLSTVDAILRDAQGNEVTHQTKVRGDGTFSLEVNLSILTGDRLELTIHQTDDVGNKSPSASQFAAIDTTGPQTLDLHVDHLANENSVSNFTISGATEPHADIEIELTDGINTVIYHGTATNDGSFNIVTDLTKLADGKIVGKVITIDTNHNTGVTKELSLTKDTEVVDLTSVEVADAGRVSSANVGSYVISGVSHEEGAIVTIEITDGVISVTDTALVIDGRFHLPLNLTRLAEGTLQVKVSQQDIAGNTSMIMTKTVEKDTEVVQPVVQTSQVTRTTTGYLYQLRGIGEANSTVTIHISGQTNPATITNTYQLDETGAFTGNIDLAPLNGQKPFIIIEQVDSFGNESRPLLTGVSSYVVGSGDNLWKISTVLGTTVDELRSLNNLTSDMIYIGQVLKVPLVAGLETAAVAEELSFNMGYLYHGSSNTYMETMKHTQGSINVVSPTYFDINADGSLKLTQVLDRYFIASMQSNGIRVVPFLSNHWDRALGEKALDNREALTDQIAEAVRIYNLDGVNIDIENVTHEYRDEYTEFTRMLRAKIPADKEVSVAVAANPRGFTLGWHGSYDYQSLGAASDYLMIMAYDESYTGSEPGPVASIQFVEKSIQYAINNGVPREKIVLGIGHYGRYWKEGATVGGNGMANEHVAQAIKMYNGVVTFDEVTMSPKATFTINEGDPGLNVYGRILQPGNYTVWFENEQSIRAKFELVEKHGIKGTGNWGLEQENPQFWDSFSQWVQEATPVTEEGSR
ncbi:LysM repeat protein [Bacillus mesophilus]|uniref:LysM peptidoglycan-binding domain-containing protein n=1 Tax=Bacillus mesophilus TaxID=1808955 RepID=A0A6M0Q986_9BACI|nr:LysM peptidoglycan-binding domain-containing protein [Bacillus mesophilus]MBM7662512.1 LysM repeat protein [Bacillus mesophilus]NEY72863.1 LysM peptidoglycan-binding domain-containing protein [Bacillus mesophilus]